MASHLLAELEIGQSGDTLVYIVECARRVASNAQPYADLIVRDASACRKARRWNLTEEEAAALAPGVMLQATVSVKEPYGRATEPQIIIRAFQVRNDVPLEQFLPAGRTEAEQLSDWRRYGELAHSITQPDLLRLLCRVFGDKDLRADFRAAPAAQSRHHAYPGGLLEHSVEVAEMALDMARHLGHVDRDLLVAGALLHDIGKTREINRGSVGFPYTTHGNLVGHVVLGSEIIGLAAQSLADVDPVVTRTLQHLVLSHHGRKDWGAPVEPATPEALILHACDELSAKAFYYREAARSAEAGSFAWVPALDRRMYFPPADDRVRETDIPASDIGPDSPWWEEPARPEIRIVAGGLAGEAPAQMAALPLYGCIAAGSAIRSEQNLEGYIALPLSGYGGAGDFLLRVTGDSMRDAHILDGDIVRVRPRAGDVRDGEIVAALVNGDATVKRFQRHAAGVLLRAENPEYPDIAVGKADDFSIQGVVVGLLREHVD